MSAIAIPQSTKAAPITSRPPKCSPPKHTPAVMAIAGNVKEAMPMAPAGNRSKSHSMQKNAMPLPAIARYSNAVSELPVSACCQSVRSKSKPAVKIAVPAIVIAGGSVASGETGGTRFA